MLIFREFFKTQSDQNIYQNAPNCTKFLFFFHGAIVYALEPLSIYVQL